MSTLSTREIAALIERAEPLFKADELLELVRLELGAALEGFQVYGKNKTRALPPASILHIISANTPEAGLQSLVCGLLLGSHNLCKLPREGLAELEAFRSALPEGLSQRVELSRSLPESWLADAEAIVVFGSDSTVEHFRGLARLDQRFVGHGHKVSFGVVFEDPQFVSAAAAARDVSLYDQQGCLSPHLFYIRGDASGYAAALARQMEEFEVHTPRRQISTPESAAIGSLREQFAFAAANGSDVHIHSSAGSSAWTVVYEADSLFRASCLNRVVFVKPFPLDWRSALKPVAQHLSAIGYWPSGTPEAETILGQLGATRLCPIGRMQEPPWNWHQDGLQRLAPLVRWIDIET